MIRPYHWVPLAGRRSQRWPLAGLGGDLTLADLVRRVAQEVPLLGPRKDKIKEMQRKGALTPQLYRDYRAWVDSLARVYIDLGARFRNHKDLADKAARQAGIDRKQLLAAFDKPFPSVVFTGMSGFGLGEPITTTVIIALIAVSAVLATYNLTSGERANATAHEEATKRIALYKEMSPEQLKSVRAAEAKLKPPPPPGGGVWDKIGTYIGLAVGGLILVAVLPTVLPRLLPKTSNPRRRRRR